MAYFINKFKQPRKSCRLDASLFYNQDDNGDRLILRIEVMLRTKGKGVVSKSIILEPEEIRHLRNMLAYRTEIKPDKGKIEMVGKSRSYIRILSETDPD